MKSTPADPPLRVFAEAFFAAHGAQVTAQADELIIDLPPALAEHFGKSRLYLVFPALQPQPRELSPHEDVLAFGSRVFDRMLALLAGRGERTTLAYPLHVTATIEALPPPALRRPAVVIDELSADYANNWFAVFNFRVVYVSDEKQEAVLTTVLDAAGQPAPEIELRLNTGIPLAESPAPPPEFDAGRLFELLERATEVTQQAIAGAITAQEQAIKSRLEKVLLRLTTFYRRRVADVDTGDPTQDEALRAELEQDLARKIQDELQRHQLAVTLTPLSLALAQVPGAHFRLAVTTAPGAAAVTPARPNVSSPPVGLPAGFTWSQTALEHCSVWVGHHWRRGVAVAVTDPAGKVIALRQNSWGKHFFGVNPKPAAIRQN